MQNKRHHHVYYITFIPLFLMLIAPQWGKATMTPTLEHFRALADRAEQEMSLLETTFEGEQRAWNLLESGEDITTYPSITKQHRDEQYASPLERYSMAETRNEVLHMRIEAMRHRFYNTVGNKNAILIDLSEQKAAIIEDGALMMHYPVSSGAWETPTPRGKFQVHSKQKMRISSQDVPYRMPYYMAFTESKSHGLHALPYLGNKATNSDYWYEALDHIGRPVSHGCVRLLPEDAEALYEWAEVGTPVLIQS